MKANLRRFPCALCLLASLALLFATSSAKAAEAFSPVVGFLKFDCPAGSDTIVSVPFHPAPRWAGRLDGVPTDPGGGVVRLSLANTPGFAPGELTDAPHLLLVREAGAAEGRHFPVVDHDEAAVHIEATLAELGTLGDEGLVSILPQWTLATLFPPVPPTTFHLSTGPLASQRGSELLFFDDATVGTDLAPTRRFYVTASGWVETGSFADADAVAILPGQAFIVRHPVGVSATQFVANQQVYGGPVSLIVRRDNGAAVDTMLALPRPVILSLEQLDFGEVFEESDSPAPADRKDELLVFDNADPERNKLPSAVYFRTGEDWREDLGTDDFPISNAREIEPSAGLLLRKAEGSGSAPLLWKNAPTYDVTAP